jgi:hypothetical protein
MKKITFLLLLLIFLSRSIFAASAPTEDIMKIGVGARPMGMGKAFVAVADDGSSPFLNPAGLAELKTWQIMSMYVSMFEGETSYTTLSGSFPFWRGILGAGFIATGTSNMSNTTSTGVSYFDYYDRIYFISYAGDGKKLFRGHNVLLGGNIKMYSKGFTGSVDNTAGGYTLDLGIKYKHNDRLSFGANFQNILATKLAWSSGSEDYIPSLVKLGGAISLGQNNARFALDMDIPWGRSVPTLFHLGVEWPISDIVTLRGGFDQVMSAASIASTNPTAGVGLNYRGFRLDYAYHPYQEAATDTAHFVSISYSPVPKAPIPSPEAEVEKEKPPVPTPEVEKEKPPTKPKVEKKIIYHRVVLGDNLWDLAWRYYGDYWEYEKIAEDNNIKNPRIIVPGQLLKIELSLKRKNFRR